MSRCMRRDAARQREAQFCFDPKRPWQIINGDLVASLLITLAGYLSNAKRTAFVEEVE